MYLSLQSINYTGLSHDIHFAPRGSPTIGPSLLKDAVMTHGLDLDLVTVLCDFKLAIIQALTLNFPNSRHRGCYYAGHLVLGLASDYNNPQDTEKCSVCWSLEKKKKKKITKKQNQSTNNKFKLSSRTCYGRTLKTSR